MSNYKSSWLYRSFFIETFYYWIHHSLYWRFCKRKSVDTLFHKQFYLGNPRYVLNEPFCLTLCSEGQQLLFSVLIRLRFPQSKSVSQIIGSGYGDTRIKRLRKFEKIDYRLRKAELHQVNLILIRIRISKTRRHY